MAVVNLSDYKESYIQTAKEYVNSLSRACGLLSKNLSNKDALSQMHIASHSIRSQSQVMGYLQTANLAGVIEKISKEAMDGKFNLSMEFVSLVKEAANELNLSLNEIKKENQEKDLSFIIKRLEE